jgi:hypothetical protein
MSAETEKILQVVQELNEPEQQRVLDFARAVLQSRKSDGRSFLHVRDPMPPDEAEEFSRAVEEAFEQIDE